MTDKRQKRILLVDDEQNLRRTLGDYLTYEGYEVQTAKSGEEALKMVAKSLPDLVLLDIAMPGIGGVGFLRRIINDEGKTRCPVLVLTAKSVMRDFFDGIAVAGFIAKPSSEKALSREVARILALAEADRGKNQKDQTKTILLCEDDTQWADKMLTTFKNAGYNMELAENGPGALERAMQLIPDAIVMKQILTGMNGSKVALLLGSMGSTKGIPILLYGAGDDVQSGLRTSKGSNSAVSKQVWSTDPATLVDAVTALFN
jgi:two-component system cell cycle response regulator